MKHVIFRAWTGSQMISSFAIIGGRCCIETNSESTDYVEVHKDNKSTCYYDNWASYKKFNYPIMQYIGRMDNSNHPIFENDIIECQMKHEKGTLPHIGEIIYDDHFGAFATKNKGGITLLHNHFLDTLKIIGNIYENPELLEYKGE